MTQERWTEVEEYITGRLIAPDAVLDAVLEASADAGLPSIQVSPNEGKLLHMLAVIRGARRILEVGTLGGYSTIWMGRALPSDGRLVTLEADPRHADVARANIASAGLERVVEVRVGAARTTLPQMVAEGQEPFDLIFIDADKAGNPEYFRWALRLARTGTVIVVDNVVRAGGVVDAASADADLQGTRRLYEAIAEEPGVTATAIQTVGSKGWDGFAIAVVLRERGT